MLDIPPVDPEAWRRRLLNLDIQTALCLMNIPFALCLTPEEYRRAVHSLRLDASLLTVLASLTGDDTFLSWRTGAAAGPRRQQRGRARDGLRARGAVRVRACPSESARRPAAYGTTGGKNGSSALNVSQIAIGRSYPA